MPRLESLRSQRRQFKQRSLNHDRRRHFLAIIKDENRLRTRKQISDTPVTHIGSVARQTGEMFLGEDLIAWLLLALGGALFVGNVLAVIKPPTPPEGSVEAAVEGPAPRPPLVRSLSFALLGLIAAVWALATLVAG